jgi:hypothetical protein
MEKLKDKVWLASMKTLTDEKILQVTLFKLLVAAYRKPAMIL